MNLKERGTSGDVLLTKCHLTKLAVHVCENENAPRVSPTRIKVLKDRQPSQRDISLSAIGKENQGKQMEYVSMSFVLLLLI